MGLAVGTAKFLVFIFNFIFFVTGIAIIAVGGVALRELGRFKDIFSDWQATLSSPAVLLVVIGVFVTIIAFFGCCGAFRHSYCMLITFSVLLGIIFILELAAGIAGYVKRDVLQEGLKTSFENSMRSVNNSEDNLQFWNELQKDGKCCGINNSSDWQTFAAWPEGEVPGSCCGLDDYKKICTRDIYENGCYNGFLEWAQSHVVVIGAVGIGVAFIQILGIVYACCLATAVKDGS